ncbi:MAG: potassium transporter Kup [Myxococcaceae bacterium]|jgi:KUP system potassium uptake protein|nr:potassium transporter Kup [Myxococcaceae bacterium]MCA3015837.1 potassium transporter Kup [Myxococcaceae bacterium]
MTAPATTRPGPSERLITSCIAALGVVYGDIGTSPLYAFRECFGGHSPMRVDPLNVLGVLSLIVWALVLVVSVKYLVLVLRADNRGEGGILALMALVLRGDASRWVVLGLGLFGAALLYGDGVITPAISVLSALEGIAVENAGFTPFIVPLSLVVLVVLFALQRRGTESVGALFGPVTALWFVAIAALGLRGILLYPSVLGALNPAHAVTFFLAHGWAGAHVLGGVFLAVTGGEALYADMGHFGVRPIRLSWFALVLPALLLNYFGQGALVLARPEAVANPFFLLAPTWAVLPLVALSTAAACIASQAVISGSFSLTRQAVQLGFCPRLEIIHTSASQIGQISVPAVNWALLVAVLLLVLGFRTSASLASAYGIAVSSTMVITAALAFLVARETWRWSLGLATFVFGGFLAVDVAFLGANALKVLDGGWLPLGLAFGLFVLMTTWSRGRAVLNERLREAALPLEAFLSALATSQVHRVPGTAVFMTGASSGTPPAALHNFKHNKVVHERVVLLTIETIDVPHVADDEHLTMTPLEQGFCRVVARCGFMQSPAVPDLLPALARQGLVLKPLDTSWFLGRETLLPTDRAGLSQWRKALFGWMSKNARPATAYFRLPPNRVVELGSQIEL